MQVIKTRKGTQYRERIYVDGKSIFSPRFERKSDAVNWKVRYLTDKAKYQSTGILPQSLQEENKVTVNEYAEKWLSTRVKLQLSQRTFEHYTATLKRHVLPLFGNLKLKEIRLTNGHTLVEKLSLNGHNAKGINLIVGVFKRMLNEATRESILERNPFQFLRELKEMPRPDVFLTLDEINKVLDVSRGHLFHSLFLMAVNTGMRRGELAGLCWDKINFDLSLMEVCRIRDRNGLGERTKTLKSRRYIPMNATVRNHLLELKERRCSELVFVGSDGKPFDVNHLFRDFRHFLKMAKIENVYRFHDLRHTFASHFMMNRGNIYDLQKILGHTSLEMTQRYAHLAPEHLVQAANVVSFGSQFQKVKLEVFESRALIEP